MAEYIKPERIWLKKHPEYSEKWVQQRIIENPRLLGLGEVVVKDAERLQPRAGRLDLLLQESDQKRYEVELQLGETDESHIIRCIEYWDIENKRYPQYDHCAVLTAEDITSRFLNVVSLFNRAVPLIAIQLQAINVGPYVTLVFTTVLDEFRSGLVDEDDDTKFQTADRAYWLDNAGKETLGMVDQLMTVVQEIDPSLEPNYNKSYIGLTKNGQATNFVKFRPQKRELRLEPALERTDEMDKEINDAGLASSNYNKYWGYYRIPISENDITQNREGIRKIVKAAFDARKNKRS